LEISAKFRQKRKPTSSHQVLPGLIGLHIYLIALEKVYFSSPNFHKSPLFLPQLQNQTNHLPELLKLCILPAWSCFEGSFATVAVVLSFSFFLIILAESLKNHSKSQKNHKVDQHKSTF
jgi:hypothetical protein